MFDPKTLFVKDIRHFLKDLTGHFLYTLFIVGITSIFTYYLVSSYLFKKIDSVISGLSGKQTPAAFIDSHPTEGLYVEKGSPYDNRTIEGATASANVIFHGSRDKPKIALTFDAEMTDGMKADVVSGKVKTSYNKNVIDILNSTQTKATLFLTGMWIELYPDVTHDLSQNPLFELGSHSYTDTSYYGFCYGLKQLSNTVKVEDIGATEKLLRQHAGIDNRLFRFPGGCYTPEDVKLVNSANDIVVHWDVVGADGFNNNVAQIVNNVVGNVQNGSIIVLHMNGAPTSPKTAEALPSIISSLKAKGFQFVKVTELLNLPPIPKAANP